MLAFPKHLGTVILAIALALSIPFSDSTAKQSAGTRIVLDEGFVGGIDPSLWEVVERPGNEAAFYTRSAVTTNPNGLRLTARRANKVDEKTGKLFKYTSGRIESRQVFRYGHFEFWARLPRGRGLWPALWLRSPEAEPFDGEIDVVEGLGSHPRSVLSTLHHWKDGKHLGQECLLYGSNAPNFSQCAHSPSGNRPDDFSAGFHRFSLDWSPMRLVWALDAKSYFVVTHDVPAVPMRIVINLAVGGGFDGAPTRQTAFPASLEVSRIRVSQPLPD
jgi:beta-glucanase (GH16 family)